MVFNNSKLAVGLSLALAACGNDPAEDVDVADVLETTDVEAETLECEELSLELRNALSALNLDGFICQDGEISRCETAEAIVRTEDLDRCSEQELTDMPFTDVAGTNCAEYACASFQADIYYGQGGTAESPSPYFDAATTNKAEFGTVLFRAFGSNTDLPSLEEMGWTEELEASLQDWYAEGARFAFRAGVFDADDILNIAGSVNREEAILAICRVKGLC